LNFTTPSKSNGTVDKTAPSQNGQVNYDLNSSSLSATLNKSYNDLNNTIQSEDEVDGTKALPSPTLAEKKKSQTVCNGASNPSHKKRSAAARDSDILDAEADAFFNSLGDIGEIGTIYHLCKLNY
jgi:hypothetical protein